MRAAALTEIADARARAHPAPPQGITLLFSTGGADAVARRWVEYIPYLLHVQAEGLVEKPFSLVPGKAATLHGRVQQRVAGSPTTQLEKQGFPGAAVKTLTVVSAEPGNATILTAVSSGPTAEA
ncbi:hypothetical protein I4F81_005032 [Pyropia yezoensis]|uniref:Uncharacterized protein n=1 Tax=Pyropia yezoensis TaxID=2788 RepID=A0ACC3BX81_PYRYE|nr:hypothetical protein I4F81_005032 [Neopyropia yezoensis]